MRRPVDAARPARYAILGLLLDGPRHGYDLLRSFAPGTPLGTTMHLGASHLYALLARLERDGLIVGEQQQQSLSPPRRVFRLTDDGRAAALRWLDEPVPRPRDVLLDFPLKLYLAQRHDPAHAALLIARQRALFAEFLAELEQEGRTQMAGPDEAFVSLLRDSRVLRTRATLAWLDRCANLLHVTAAQG
jgi:DNA-binding PadR family transcriptional regulator